MKNIWLDSMDIFGAYDIRGIYPNDINKDIGILAGMAFGTYLRKGTVIVGRDIRYGSDEIASGVIEGLRKTGINVINIGIVTTPMLYFSVREFKADGGVMITASHNPPEYNGIKFVGKNSKFIGLESGLEKIKDLFLARKFKISERKGYLKNRRIINKYIAHIKKKIKLEKKIKIAVDVCNSVPSLIAPKLLKEIGCKVVVINEKIDPSFPAHLPNPDKDNLKELIKVVKEKNLDFGVGYDGDGDRSVFVDDKGRVLNGSETLYVLIELMNVKNEKIVFDVSSSSFIENKIKESGNIPVVERVGRTYIKDKLEKVNGIVAGEFSGHFYFRDIGYLDDGIYATAKMAELISKNKVRMSSIVDSIPKSIRVYKKIKVKDKDRFMKELGEKIRKKYRPITIDGFKVNFKNGWFLIRPSNTEPIIKIMIEAKNEKSLKKIEKELNLLLEKAV